jgi:hypothetical protein
MKIANCERQFCLSARTAAGGVTRFSVNLHFSILNSQFAIPRLPRRPLHS